MKLMEANSFKNSMILKITYSMLSILIGMYLAGIGCWLVVSIIALTNPTLQIHAVDLFGIGSGQSKTYGIDYSIFGRYSEIVYFGISLAILLAILFVILFLKKFLKNVYDEKPFIEENGRHLKRIGSIIVITSMIFYFLNFLSSFSYSFLTPLMQLGNSITIIINPFTVLGFVIVVVGETFIYGARIKQENDLTV